MGILVQAVGLGGSGKSSTLRVLHELISETSLFVEDEEALWPESCTRRDLVGEFSNLMGFRSLRIPLYWKADEARAKGKIALLDSYYDKVIDDLLTKENTDWLIKKDDPYFSIYLEIAKLDEQLLPEPDVIVFFKVDCYEFWKKLLFKRNRDYDREQGNEETLRANYATQVYLEESVAKFKARGAEVIVLEQKESSTIEDNAVYIKDCLEQLGILSGNLKNSSCELSC